MVTGNTGLKCEDRSCKGRAITNNRDIVSVSKHAHGPKTVEGEEWLMCNKMLTRNN